MHLVQFELSNGERRVGVVEDGLVREVQDARTVRDLALAAIEAGNTLAQQVQTLGLGISHDYAELLAQLRILHFMHQTALDHPDTALAVTQFELNQMHKSSPIPSKTQRSHRGQC